MKKRFIILSIATLGPSPMKVFHYIASRSIGDVWISNEKSKEEISMAVSIPMTTINRHIKMLVDQGFLVKQEHTKYLIDSTARSVVDIYWEVNER